MSQKADDGRVEGSKEQAGHSWARLKCVPVCPKHSLFGQREQSTDRVGARSNA